jgi:hypothetical protein
VRSNEWGHIMNRCSGTFARSYGRCLCCAAHFEPAPVEGLCTTIPPHEAVPVAAEAHADEAA